METGPRSDVEVILAFGREVADLDEPRQVLRALLERVDALFPAAGVLLFAVDGGGSPAVVEATRVAPEVLARARDVEFLGTELADDLVPAGSEMAVVEPLIAGGLLYGAVAVVFAAPPDRGARLRLEGLADVAGVACDRAHKTQELVRTIDALQTSQRALARAEQLKAMGQMAAVIAHEVKNPLASIGGVLQVIQGRMAPSSQERTIIGKLLQRLADLNRLVDELLTFARPRPLDTSRVDLAALVRDAVGAFRRDPRFEGVRVRVQADPVQVELDPVMFRAVLDNLLINAGQAMEGEGAITVGLVASAGRAELVVADRGPGMPDEVREQIFEPFFTTKTRGTGLGLPTAKRVVEAHHGTLAVACPEGGGTVFTVVLPVIEG